jgi:hypothetical protein
LKKESGGRRASLVFSRVHDFVVVVVVFFFFVFLFDFSGDFFFFFAVGVVSNLPIEPKKTKSEQREKKERQSAKFPLFPTSEIVGRDKESNFRRGFSFLVWFVGVLAIFRWCFGAQVRECFRGVWLCGAGVEREKTAQEFSSHKKNKGLPEKKRSSVPCSKSKHTTKWNKRQKREQKSFPHIFFLFFAFSPWLASKQTSPPLKWNKTDTFSDKLHPNGTRSTFS